MSSQVELCYPVLATHISGRSDRSHRADDARAARTLSYSALVSAPFKHGLSYAGRPDVAHITTAALPSLQFLEGRLALPPLAGRPPALTAAFTKKSDVMATTATNTVSQSRTVWQYPRDAYLPNSTAWFRAARAAK